MALPSNFSSNSPWHFSIVERWLMSLAILFLVAGLIGYIINQKRPTHEAPLAGGTLTEGVIADSPTKVDRLITGLTNIGLTYRDTDDTIKPGLASSWDISNDGKTYRFHLRQGYNAQDLLTTIKNNKTDWDNLTLSAPDISTLQFDLPEAFSTFLGTTTHALFPYGPYEVVKRDKKEVTLKSNNKFVLDPPHIAKITLKQYDSIDQLQKAIKTKEINASADLSDNKPVGFSEYTISLPRYHILFFNSTRTTLKKLEDRMRVINRTDGSPVTYTLLTNQIKEASDLAAQLANDLKSQHITLTVIKKNSLTLQKEDIPKRDFDLLLYGVNYGIDTDYYPFWHSSQVNSPGLNLSGVKDKELDNLLESARKEIDIDKRKALTNQIEVYLSSHGLQQVISQEKTQYWVSPSVKGVQYAKMDESTNRFNLVWRWYIKYYKVP